MKEKEVKTKQIIEASATNQIESINSIKLTATAGGEIRPEVKVYHVDPNEAMNKATEIMDKLVKKYKVKE